MKRQIAITLIFLIISIAALGMASYAWFSNNRSVTAGGMVVSVEMPINIMASLTPPPDTENPGEPSFVTSLDGYQNSFQFGEITGESGSEQILEYDMLVPVTSADGIHFFYLPFRYVGENGCPKSSVTLDDYRYLTDISSVGYYIDIPLYVLTTTPLDLNVYVSYLNIFSAGFGDDIPEISGAVRASVLVREEDGYRSLIVARDTDAEPLTDGTKTYYPLAYDSTSGGAAEQTADAATTESAEYAPSAENSFTLAASESVEAIPRYYVTELRVRIWVEGSDAAAVYNNAGAYFSVSLALAVDES